jgi:hypothetical protein
VILHRVCLPNNQYLFAFPFSLPQSLIAPLHGGTVADKAGYI